MNDVYEDEDYLPKDEELKAIVSSPQERDSRSTTITADSGSPEPEPNLTDPGLKVLFSNSSLNNAELLRNPQPSADFEMIDQEGDARPPSEDVLQRPGISTVQGPEAAVAHTPVDSAVELKHVKANTRDPHGLAADPSNVSAELVTRSKVDRVDSANTNGSTSPTKHPFTKPAIKSPLKVNTSPQPITEDSIRDPPTLSKHTLPAAEENDVSMPPYEPTSPSVASPNKLPSFRQLTGSLTELAEAATAEMRPQQTYSHNHSRSFGSTTSQSPIPSHHPYPQSIQPSPQAYYPPSVSARSPTSTISESQHYGSPPAYVYNGVFSHRRPSIAHDTPPALPPSLPSASSSGESHGYPGSSTDGYSTNHTTPIDHMPDGTPRPVVMLQMLPPLNGVPQMMVPGPFQCDVPGCNAGTFQTQYLLR